MNWLNIISICISALSMYFAYKALSAWKSQKKYEAYKCAYKFLISLQEKIVYMKELYKELDLFDETEEENRINEEIGQYFKKNLGLVKSVELDLIQVSNKNKIIPYFAEKFKLYSGKISDRPCSSIQRVCNYETGEEWDIDPYNKNFYEDFFLTDEEDNKKELYITFHKNIDEGLESFAKEIKKFFK